VLNIHLFIETSAYFSIASFFSLGITIFIPSTHVLPDTIYFIAFLFERVLALSMSCKKINVPICVLFYDFGHQLTEFFATKPPFRR
jgi:hypothetical protein